MDIKEGKQQVIRAGKELSETELISRTWGNVSCRIDLESFLITASGKNYLTLVDDEVIQVKSKDLTYEGKVKPSSEKRIHREIYRLRNDVNFVIHTHQNNASAISAMGLDSITLDKDYPGLGREIICADYGLPGTKKLCKHTAGAVSLLPNKAVILKHHGAVCYGRDYEEAFAVSRTLEEACGNYLAKLSRIFTEEQEGQPSPDSSDENILWNTSMPVRTFSKKGISLRPFLDDFSQIVGTKAKCIKNNKEEIHDAIKKGKTVLVRGKGALCIGRTGKETEAISMLVEKNCKAYFASEAVGGNPIKPWECALMRQIYLRKYYKLGV
ncbi:MAG: class II aldolase/adducin family protein [Anaerovoracaceae bacterium]